MRRQWTRDTHPSLDSGDFDIEEMPFRAEDMPAAGQAPPTAAEDPPNVAEEPRIDPQEPPAAPQPSRVTAGPPPRPAINRAPPPAARPAREPRRFDQWRAGPFAHHRYDVFVVARDALVHGARLALALPDGHAFLAKKLRVALVGMYLAIADAGTRAGRQRSDAFREARARAAAAAALLEAVTALGIAEPPAVEPITALLSRVCAMLTRIVSNDSQAS